MAQQIQIRRGTAAQWTTANTTLAAGEMGIETDTRKIKIGNGASAWASLSYSYADTQAAALAAQPSINVSNVPFQPLSACLLALIGFTQAFTVFGSTILALGGIGLTQIITDNNGLNPVSVWVNALIYFYEEYYTDHSGASLSINVYLNNNALDQTTVDNLLSSLADVISSGPPIPIALTVGLSGGTNASPTGGVNNQDIQTIQNYGGTVTIN